MPSQVFLSYSHADEAWKDRLVKHLEVLAQEGLLEVWDDRRIMAGEAWEEQIRTAMEEASVAVLLVSKEFLTSKFVRGVEVPRLLERRLQEGMRIVPLLVHSCLWRQVKWLAALEVRPRDARPLASFRGDRVDEQLTAIAEELLGLLGESRATGLSLASGREDTREGSSGSTAAGDAKLPSSWLERGKAAARKRRRSLLLTAAVAGAAMLLVALWTVVGPVQLLKTPPLNRNIVVADFVNETGENNLNGLSGMFITSLQQYSQLTVLSRTQMFDALKQDERAKADRIDEALGREICKRTGASTLIAATVHKFDEFYVIDLKLVDPKTARYVLSLEEKGKGQPSILAILDRLTYDLRSRLKESTGVGHVSIGSVANVTTTNLDAYQHFFRGQTLLQQDKGTEAIEELLKAVEIDPTFALAHYEISVAAADGDPLEFKHVREAMRFIDRVPEHAKCLVKANYALIVHENIEESIELLRACAERFKDDGEVLRELGEVSFLAGDWSEALPPLQRVIDLDPLAERALGELLSSLYAAGRSDQMVASAQHFVNSELSADSLPWLGRAYEANGQPQQALEIYQREVTLFPGRVVPVLELGSFHLRHDRVDAAERELTVAENLDGQPIDRLSVSMFSVELRVYRGQLREAERLAAKYMVAASEVDNVAAHDWMVLLKAIWLASLKSDQAAARNALSELQGRDRVSWSWHMLARVLVHDYDGANKTIHARRYPAFRAWITAARWSDEGNPVRALEELQGSLERLPSGDRIEGLARLAQAAVQAGRPEEGIGAIGRLDRTPPLSWNPDWYRSVWIPDWYWILEYPRSFYWRGRAYEETGNRQAAMESYRGFLRIWQDADSDLPDLKDAKVRLAALASLERGIRN